MTDIEKIQSAAKQGLSNLGYATNQHAADVGLMLDLAAANFEGAAKLVRELRKKLTKKKNVGQI